MKCSECNKGPCKYTVYSTSGRKVEKEGCMVEKVEDKNEFQFSTTAETIVHVISENFSS